MSYETEQAVIGGLLLKPDLISDMDLLADDFENESCRVVFQEIIDSFVANRAIDVMTISERLQRESGNDFEWLPYIGRMASNCPSPGLSVNYAALVKEDSRNRRAKEICVDVLNNIDSSKDAAAVIDSAVRELMEISSTRKSYEYSTSEMLAKAVDMIDRYSEVKDGESVGVPTGISKLDEVTGGFHKGDLTVIGARPAMGKTAMLLNLINNHKYHSGLISSEQPVEQIGLRLIAIDGKISAQKMRTGSMESDDYHKLSSSVRRMHANANIWTNDRSGISLVDLIRQARKWKHRHDIQVLYVDYIQRIRCGDNKMQRWEQVGAVVMGLKELARELDIPVIALSQVNRDVEKRADKRPGMGDLANSSEIEKEADVVMTLYRDEVYNDATPDVGVMEILVCKNRHGPTGKVFAMWVKDHMRVVSAD